MTDMTISERNKVDIEVSSAVQHDGYKAFQRIDELEDRIDHMDTEKAVARVDALEAQLPDYVQKADITDNHTSTDTDKPLSANQGKVIWDYVNQYVSQTYRALIGNIGSMSNAFSSMAGDYSQHKSKSESELTEHETKLSDLEKRLTALESAGSGADPLTIYPVGSIYLSVNATSPAELFGGTWEQIKDTFLLASGDTYEAGSTGGVSENKLKDINMPYHTHSYRTVKDTDLSEAEVGSKYADVAITHPVGVTRYINNQDVWPYGYYNPEAINNMPPYLTVFVWKRTA